MNLSGRRLISQVGVEPKMLTSANTRIDALRPALRVVSNRHVEHDKHGEHWGYVAMLGVAVGMVALICFYLCLWLVRHQSRQRSPGNQAPLPPPHDHQNHDIHAHDGDSYQSSHELMKRAPCGDGLHALQAWNSECVELVVMAGEHVPTFVAHPIVQHLLLEM